MVIDIFEWLQTVQVIGWTAAKQENIVLKLRNKYTKAHF